MGLYYNGNNTNFAKSLRKNMTPWERKLWHCFLKTYPIRFQRQKQIDKYIVDFFCAKAHLIIELDGGGHYEPQAQKEDKNRTIQLEKYGYKVIRFCNRDVDKNFYSVITVIDREVKKRTLPQSPNGDSPLNEGAKASESV